MVFKKNLVVGRRFFWELIYIYIYITNLSHIYKFIETFRKIVILLQSLNDKGKQKNNGLK